MFEKFETENIDQCYEYLRSLGAQVATRVGPDADPLRIIATGGGAYKYYDEIREKAGMEVQREDEMECLIRGKYPKSPCSPTTAEARRPPLPHHQNTRGNIHLW